MADEFLKKLHEGIEAHEAEMANYRARLGRRLADTAPLRPLRPMVFAATFCAAVLIVAALILPFVILEPGLATMDLDQLQRLAASPPPMTSLVARLASATGSPFERCNALMLLTLSEQGEAAARHAARGLAMDPRPEFRYVYLELLLDQADEYPYCIARIEELMDRETDSECLDLLGTLLRLAT